MGADHERPTPDRQAVFADLVGALQELRGGVHGGEMAAAVFRHTTGGTSLVGLTAEGRRAVLYQPDARTLVAAPLNEHGLDHDDASPLWTGLSDPTTWVDAHGDDLAWVHPRYRWALGEGAVARRT